MTCPHCWEAIVIDVDLSGGSATYTEDCSVCCNPLQVQLTVSETSGRWRVDVRSEDDCG